MPTAARSRVGTSVIAASGRPASRRPCTRHSWIARHERKLSEPPRRITALPDFRQSTPASAVTLGRLSKITPTTPSGTRTRSMVRPFGRCQLSVTMPTGSAMPRTTATPSAMPSTRAGVSVRRSMKEEVALPDAAPRRRPRHWRRGSLRIAADRPLHGHQRPVLLLRRRQRQHARGGAGTGGEIGHQRLKIGIAVNGFEGGGHGSSNLLLRQCPSTEIPRLRRAGRVWQVARLAGRLGQWPSKKGRDGPYPPTTRSSRWIISERPLMPRMDITSGEERPLIRSATSAS